VGAIHVPQTGIVVYLQVALAFGRKIMQQEGGIFLGHKVLEINQKDSINYIETSKGTFQAKLVVNCAGLYSDKVAQMNDTSIDDVKIIPFRGEYFKLKAEREHLVKNLIYPVPEPNFPFLGVHFTRMIHGGIKAGPNAILAFKREGYRKNQVNLAELAETLTWPGFRKVAGKYWKTGLEELYRSFSKSAFTKALQELIPEIQESDLVAGGAGVRAQACDRSGGLLDDFAIRESEFSINVLNAPSPAATSSLSIGGTVAEMVLKRF
jgi:L-2-hydroxyglutarate oxidase